MFAAVLIIILAISHRFKVVVIVNRPIMLVGVTLWFRLPQAALSLVFVAIILLISMIMMLKGSTISVLLLLLLGFGSFSSH